MEVVDSIDALRAARPRLKGGVGLVPTMGALHDGHLSLVAAACDDNDSVIATIFVNPTQFAPNEDLAAYPRDLPGDLAKFEAAGVHLVFTPTPEMMYPPGFQTYVTVEQVSQGLEGAQRPGHFRGVATIVSKLFNLTQPDTAYFGQKDAQQVVVIRQMVRDLNFPLNVVICPILREADGLAMSSRNVYLTPEQRKAAPVIHRALKTAADAYKDGERNASHLIATVEAILNNEPQATPDFIAINDARTLAHVDKLGEEPVLLSTTVRIGTVRLLDNCLLPYHLNTRDGATSALGI